MQRGVIGTPESEAGRLTTVESYHDTREEYDRRLEAALSAGEQHTLTGGSAYIEGTALKEEVQETSEWSYNPETESIDRGATREKVQHTSNFVAVPANETHRGFAMVSSSDGEFAFNVVGRADYTLMSRAEIQLGDFYLDHQDKFTVQTGGGHGDHADTIMAWGHNVDEDTAVGRPFEEAVKANTLPQLAGRYTSDVLAEIMEVNIAASGYVEVWDPDLSTPQFCEWVQEDILPYVRNSDADRDKSERARDDPAQNDLGAFDDGHEDEDDA